MNNNLKQGYGDSNRSIFAVTIVAWFIILLVYYYVQGYPEKDLLDTDAFTRLVRVEQLATDHDWYNSVIPRSNAPHGETLHWTRPLDILLLLGAGALTPLFGFHKALYWWGVVISPILGVISLAAMAWAAQPVLDRENRRWVWILFLGQFLLVSVYHFGRPDHHSLLSLLFIGLIGCLLRLAEPEPNRKMALWVGLLAGVAMWVSVEALAGVVLVFIALAILWVLHGGGYLDKLHVFAGTLLVCSAVFLLSEYPLRALLSFEYDRISAVHIIIFALAAVSVFILRAFTSKGRTYRLSAALVIAAADFALLWFTIPAFFKGPFSQVNSEIIPIWLDWVIEVQPLLADSTITIVTVIGSITVASGFVIYRLILKKCDRQTEYLLTFLIGLLVFIPLTFYQIRWVYYCSALLVIPLAMALSQIMNRLSSIKKDGLRALARAGTIVLFLFGFLLLGVILDTPENPADAADSKPPTRVLCNWLNDPGSNLPASAVIMIDIDYGPEILYRTPHQVIATPYHRNDAGILFNHRVMTSANAEAARVVISERPVDLLILTPESSEKVIYKAAENPNIFYNQLLAGQVPEWLIPVPTPPGVSEWFLVFKVID